MTQVAARPESFSIRDRDIRRVNLERFPYHFLFRIVGDTVRILAVRRRRTASIACNPTPITSDETRKMALEIPKAVERTHMNHPDFRVAGKIFASLGVPDENSGHGEAYPGATAHIH